MLHRRVGWPHDLRLKMNFVDRFIVVRGEPQHFRLVERFTKRLIKLISLFHVVVFILTARLHVLKLSRQIIRANNNSQKD